MNKKIFIKRWPIVTAFLFLLLLSFFSALGAITSEMLKLSETHSMYIYALSFIISASTAVLIMKKTHYSFLDYGVTLDKTNSIMGFLDFLPLIFVTGFLFIVGIDTTISIAYIIPLLLYILAASINEELYFRGLILKVLRVKGVGFAVIVSSLFFGFSHIGSLLAGKGIEHTLLLVAFSALFAIVSALLVISTRSLLIPIVWHFSHNLVSSITMEATPQTTLLIVGIQCVVLFVYAMYLWRKIHLANQLELAKS